MNDLDAFGIVANELERGELHQGLWMQCLVKCKGNPEKTKAQYAKDRATMLKQEHHEQEARLQNQQAKNAAQWRERAAALIDEIQLSCNEFPSKEALLAMRTRIIQFRKVNPPPANTGGEFVSAEKRVTDLIEECVDHSRILSMVAKSFAEGKKWQAGMNADALTSRRFKGLDYQLAERMSRRRGRIFLFLALLFLAISYAYFAIHGP